MEHLTLNEFQDYVELLWRVNHIVHSHDVRVLELLHNCDLAFDADFPLTLLIEFELLIDFDCKNQSSWFMRCHLDRCIGAGAEMFSDLVVCDLGIIARTVVAFFSSPCQYNYLIKHLLLTRFILMTKLIIRIEFVIELVPDMRPRKFFFSAQMALTVGISLFCYYKKEREKGQ